MSTAHPLRTALPLLLILSSIACKDRPTAPAAAGPVTVAKLRWGPNTDPATEAVVRRIAADLTASGVALLAAQDPELRAAWPGLIGQRTNQSQVESEVLSVMRDECKAEVSAPEVIIRCTRSGAAGVALTNAVARAIIATTTDQFAREIAAQKQTLQVAFNAARLAKADLIQKQTELAAIDLSPDDAPVKPQRIVELKKQLIALDEKITVAAREYDLKYSALQDLITAERQLRHNPRLWIAQPATVVGQ